MGNADAQVSMDNVHGIKVTGGSFPAMIWQNSCTTPTATTRRRPSSMPTTPVRFDPFFQSTLLGGPDLEQHVTTSTVRPRRRSVHDDRRPRHEPERLPTDSLPTGASTAPPGARLTNVPSTNF